MILFLRESVIGLHDSISIIANIRVFKSYRQAKGHCKHDGTQQQQTNEPAIRILAHLYFANRKIQPQLANAQNIREPKFSNCTQDTKK